MATKRYTDNPRARTQRGNVSWAAAFNVVSVISQAIPEITRKGNAAANGSQATATIATPYAAADAASCRLSDSLTRISPATVTASTAPEPTAATETP